MTPRLLALSPSCFQPVNRAVFREIVGMGAPVHLVAPAQRFDDGVWKDAPKAPPEGYEITYAPLKGRNLRVQTFEGLKPIAEAFRPTHVFVDADPASLLVRQARQIGRDAKIWSITAENLPQDNWAELGAALRRGQGKAALGAGVKTALRLFVQPGVDRVFTLSSDGSAVMRGMGLNATQIPLGFDPALFRPDPELRAAARAALGLDQPTIAYFGRMTPEKGVHLLIEALSGLRDLDWRFLIDDFQGGVTDYGDRLRRLIDEAGVADRVAFFEARHEEMPRFMNAADIVVLPSVSTRKWKEQYGRVIQEVMACGRTMVGSSSGAIPEVMGGHGHVFPEGDVAALGALLARLLKDGVFEDAAARDYAHAALSIERQASIMVAAMREDLAAA